MVFGNLFSSQQSAASSQQPAASSQQPAAKGRACTAWSTLPGLLRVRGGTMK
jgi:hypothetical protein